MKLLSILFLLLLSANTFAQTFKNREIKRLNSFGIDLTSIDLNEETNYLNLETILKKEKKRRTNKTVGIALTTLGLLTTGFGTALIVNSKDQEEGLPQSIGTMFVAMGVVELGISIPIFIATSKRKKERDKLIRIFK